MASSPLPKTTRRALRELGFPNRLSAYVWLGLFLAFVPLTTALRFVDLSNPVMEPHPIRQTQTALTAVMLFRGEASVVDYRSPEGGHLFRMVYEFPFYQWLVALAMRLGLGLEVAARLVCLAFFTAGCACFWGIARRLFDPHVAAWATLFYWITPFHVIYSRVCLIEATAVALVLGAAWAALRALETAPRRFTAWCAASALAGVLAAMVKLTYWYAPAGVGFLAVAWLAWKGRLDRRRAGWLLATLLVQLAVGVAWAAWASELRGEIASVRDWQIGPLAERFSPAAWWRVLRPVLRHLLHDWMIVPTVAALWLPRVYRDRVLILLGVALLGAVGPFHVHQYHDYYAFTEAPFLLAAAGAGAAWLFSHGSVAARAALAVTALVLAGRTLRLPYVYGSLFANQRPVVEAEYALGRVTDPLDLVYAEAPMERWEIPLYSGRHVILAPHFPGSGLSPSVFVFARGPFRPDLFRGSESVWIDGLAENKPVYRVRNVGPFRFDPGRHVAAVGGEPRGPTTPASTDYDACAASIAVPSPPGTGDIVVTFLEKGRSMPLPRREWVRLPSASPWGCRFTVR